MIAAMTKDAWTTDEELIRMCTDVALCREELTDKRPAPTTLDSILFAMTELAEYAEAARLRPNAGYVRNNERQFDPRRELAQTGEMIFTAIWKIDTEDRIQDAGGAMIGQTTYHLAVALMAWSRSQRNLANSALELAAKSWRDLALLVGEQPEQLITDELTRIRGKFSGVDKTNNAIQAQELPPTKEVDFIRVEGICHVWLEQPLKKND